ncbi:MAG: hypothetical protein LBN25_03125 [Christensenellaceae bacterium]|jgi:ribosomal protein L40E|nr:hypothetical protein [Christensenellaceae bacterium]
MGDNVEEAKIPTRAELKYICPACGSENGIDTAYCVKCGSERQRGEFVEQLRKLYGKNRPAEEKSEANELDVDIVSAPAEEVAEPVTVDEVPQEPIPDDTVLYVLDDAPAAAPAAPYMPFIVVPYVNQGQPLYQYDPSMAYVLETPKPEDDAKK